MKVGIGISSYNRQDSLYDCLNGVRKFTTRNCEILVSDDGSMDNSVDVAKILGFKVIANQNKGVAYNKNRLLYNLMLKGCDIIILLEDDVMPVADGWEDIWIEGAKTYGSVFFLTNCDVGKGTLVSPFISKDTTAQLLALDREAITKVGFFDPRFKGFGYEHCEYQNRLAINGFGGINFRHGFGFFALNSDKLVNLDVESTADEDKMAQNSKLYVETFGQKNFVIPVLSKDEVNTFRQEAFNYV